MPLHICGACAKLGALAAGRHYCDDCERTFAAAVQQCEAALPHAPSRSEFLQWAATNHSDAIKRFDTMTSAPTPFLREQMPEIFLTSEFCSAAM